MNGNIYDKSSRFEDWISQLKRSLGDCLTIWVHLASNRVIELCSCLLVSKLPLLPLIIRSGSCGVASRADNHCLPRLQLNAVLALVQRRAHRRVRLVRLEVIVEARLRHVVSAGECGALRGRSAVTCDAEIETGHVELRTDGEHLEAWRGGNGEVQSNDLVTIG